MLDWLAGASLANLDDGGKVGTELGSWSIACGSTHVDAQRLGPGGSVEYRRFDIDERTEADQWIRGYTEPKESADG